MDCVPVQYIFFEHKRHGAASSLPLLSPQWEGKGRALFTGNARVLSAHQKTRQREKQETIFFSRIYTKK